jgi:hypothetical protein
VQRLAATERGQNIALFKEVFDNAFYVKRLFQD